MSSGAAKSGKPCERLTAPCLSASRVISRITDSVNELAFRETRFFEVEEVDISYHFSASMEGSQYHLAVAGGCGASRSINEPRCAPVRYGEVVLTPLNRRPLCFE